MSNDYAGSDMSLIYEISRLTDNRAWMAGNFGAQVPEMTPAVSLDVSKFDQAKHYPGGLIRPGIVLGKITASGLWGPYDPAATDGRQTAKALLFDAPQLLPGIKAQVLLHGFVIPANLPANNGLDAAARTALKNIIFTDV